MVRVVARVVKDDQGNAAPSAEQLIRSFKPSQCQVWHPVVVPFRTQLQHLHDWHERSPGNPCYFIDAGYNASIVDPLEYFVGSETTLGFVPSVIRRNLENGKKIYFAMGAISGELKKTTVDLVEPFSLKERHDRAKVRLESGEMVAMNIPSSQSFWDLFRQITSSSSFRDHRAKLTYIIRLQILSERQTSAPFITIVVLNERHFRKMVPSLVGGASFPSKQDQQVMSGYEALRYFGATALDRCEPFLLLRVPEYLQVSDDFLSLERFVAKIAESAPNGEQRAAIHETPSAGQHPAPIRPAESGIATPQVPELPRGLRQSDSRDASHVHDDEPSRSEKLHDAGYPTASVASKEIRREVETASPKSNRTVPLPVETPLSYTPSPGAIKKAPPAVPPLPVSPPRELPIRTSVFSPPRALQEVEREKQTCAVAYHELQQDFNRLVGALRGLLNTHKEKRDELQIVQHRCEEVRKRQKRTTERMAQLEAVCTELASESEAIAESIAGHRKRIQTLQSTEESFAADASRQADHERRVHQRYSEETDDILSNLEKKLSNEKHMLEVEMTARKGEIRKERDFLDNRVDALQTDLLKPNSVHDKLQLQADNLSIEKRALEKKVSTLRQTIQELRDSTRSGRAVREELKEKQARFRAAQCETRFLNAEKMRHQEKVEKTKLEFGLSTTRQHNAVNAIRETFRRHLEEERIAFEDDEESARLNVFMGFLEELVEAKNLERREASLHHNPNPPPCTMCSSLDAEAQLHRRAVEETQAAEAHCVNLFLALQDRVEQTISSQKVELENLNEHSKALVGRISEAKERKSHTRGEKRKQLETEQLLALSLYRQLLAQVQRETNGFAVESSDGWSHTKKDPAEDSVAVQEAIATSYLNWVADLARCRELDSKVGVVTRASKEAEQTLRSAEDTLEASRAELTGKAKKLESLRDKEKQIIEEYDSLNLKCDLAEKDLRARISRTCENGTLQYQDAVDDVNTALSALDAVKRDVAAISREANKLVSEIEEESPVDDLEAQVSTLRDANSELEQNLKSKIQREALTSAKKLAGFRILTASEEETRPASPLEYPPPPQAFQRETKREPTSPLSSKEFSPLKSTALATPPTATQRSKAVDDAKSIIRSKNLY